MRRSTSFLLSSWALALVLALTALVGGAAASSRAVAQGPVAGTPDVVVAASGTLCVTKFNDVNGDGVKGATEPTLSGWVFTIRSLPGAVLGTITTSGSTRTCTDVPAGTLSVSETQQAGWTPTVPADGSQTATITAGHTTTVTFGNRQARTGTLRVTKYNDLDGDGLKGATEPTLSGWVFTIRDPNGNVVGTITTATTAISTEASIDLPAGTYTVSETQQAGWTPTVPASGSQTVTIAMGQIWPIAFGNRQTTSGALILAATSPFMNNNAIHWGEYVDLMTTGPSGTVFSMQVTTDNVTWQTLTDSSGSPLSFTIGSGGTSTYRYTPIRNYWYRCVAGTTMSNSPRVTVRQTISVKPSIAGRKTISHGSAVTFTATVRPARPELEKATVHFEVWKMSLNRWALSASSTKTIDGDGVAAWTWTASSTGSYYFRAQAQPTPVNANSFWSPNLYYTVN